MLKSRLAPVLLTVAFAVAVGSCSRIKFAYGYVDVLIEDQIHDYLDLDAKQSALVSDEVDAYMKWHRETQLPKIAGWLERVADIQASGRFNRELYETNGKAVGDMFKEHAHGAVPGVTKVLATLRDDQLDGLDERLRERHQELVERANKPREELLAERKEGFADTFEMFCGDLTPQQATRVEKRLAELFTHSKPWLDSRQRRYDMLMQTLRSHPSQSQLARFMSMWITEAEDMQTPEYRAYAQKFMKGYSDLLYEVLASLTPEQRKTLVENLRGYARDFKDLSA